MQGPSIGRVPVMSNASLVTGTVQAFQPATPDTGHPVLKLLIHRVEDIDGLANFCADEEGNTIPIRLRGQARDRWPKPQDHIRLRVEFRGDERGGGYYANAEDMEAVAKVDPGE